MSTPRNFTEDVEQNGSESRYRNNVRGKHDTSSRKRSCDGQGYPNTAYFLPWIISLVLIVLITCAVIYVIIDHVVANGGESADKNEVNSVCIEVVSYREHVANIQRAPEVSGKALVPPTPRPQNSSEKSQKGTPLKLEPTTPKKTESSSRESDVKCEKKPVKNSSKSDKPAPSAVSTSTSTSNANSCPKPLLTTKIIEKPPENCSLSSEKEKGKPAEKAKSQTVEGQSGSAEIEVSTPPFPPEATLPPKPSKLSAATPSNSSNMASEMSLAVPVSSQRSEASQFNLIEAGRTPPNDENAAAEMFVSAKSLSGETMPTTTAATLVPLGTDQSETSVSMRTPTFCKK
uniref:Uncharacterized protein n=1 Tax=Caenorhabditis japonica TaxID=281687 RepID=A0A8R1DVC6_CAEJA